MILTTWQSSRSNVRAGYSHERLIHEEICLQRIWTARAALKIYYELFKTSISLCRNPREVQDFFYGGLKNVDRKKKDEIMENNYNDESITGLPFKSHRFQSHGIHSVLFLARLNLVFFFRFLVFYHSHLVFYSILLAPHFYFYYSAIFEPTIELRINLKLVWPSPLFLRVCARARTREKESERLD